jgi:hypothetical protein
LVSSARKKNNNNEREQQEEKPGAGAIGALRLEKGTVMNGVWGRRRREVGGR